MGKSSGSQTQKTEPWSGQQPFLRFGFDQAQNLYNSGGPQYYPNATYTPFSSQTEQGLGMLQNRAIQGSPVEQAMQGYITNTLNNPGGGAQQGFLNQTMGNPNVSGAFNTLGSYGQGAPDFAGQMGNVPMTALERTAGGDFMRQNPYLDRQFNAASRAVTDRFNDAVLPGLNATFAGAGGAGSGVHREIALDAADELGQNLTDMAANIYGNNFQNERNRMLQASGMLNQDDLARRGLSAEMFNYDQNRGLQGAGALLNAGLGAAGQSTNLMGVQGDIARGAAALAPTAAQFDYNNINNLLGVGQAVEGKAGEALGDSMNRFNYYQNLPEDNLARYIAAIQGNYGSTTQSKGSGNPVAGALGGGILGSQLSGYLGSQMLPSSLSWLGGPALGIGGAILGGLLS